jgi:hypothetical protein
MHSPLDFLARTAEMYPDLHVGVDMDLLFSTPVEVERNRDRPFIRRILENGIVIHEKSATR